MFLIPDLIKARRKQLGLTQVQLAQLSEVSLPTIQNAESIDSNLSYNTLQKLLQSLQIEMDFKLKSVDWNILSEVGVPISPLNKTIKVKNVIKILNEQVPLVTLYNTRESDALLAYVWSLKTHYKDIYQQLSSVVKIKMEKIFSSQEFKKNSKLIKLKRICVDQIAKWLIP